ncbi:MAG: DUF5694 domain-containing protein [Acidobacteriia bacterium]|nr:DUF5694 domain-containing protein [Terriglobia bacterium]
MRRFLSRMLPIFAFLACAHAASQKDNSCKPGMTQVMILGTYHMNNPGQDKYNLKADDVLTAQKQKEIDEVLDRLQRFRPSKIAVEGQYNQSIWTSRYADYIAGKHELGRNEIEQIGFKLAKRLNHSTIYPVDYQMWMDGRVPAEIAPPVKPPKPAPASSSADNQARPDWVVQGDEVLKKSTVLEYLRFANSEEAKRPDHASYLDMLLPDETDAPYGQADEVTNWYKRNIRILTNINRVADLSNDRILLLIGSGHLTILSDLVRQTNYYCLVDVEDYLK